MYTIKDFTDTLEFGTTVSKRFLIERRNIDNNAIEKIESLKLRSDIVGNEADLNVGPSDISEVFEIVKLFQEQIVDNQTNKSQYTRVIDSFGDSIQATLGNQLMVSTNVRLSGGVFNGDFPDSNFFATSNTSNGTAVIVNSELILTTTADSGSSSMVNTIAKARQIGGNMNEYRERVRLDVLDATNNVRRWGLFENSQLLNAVYFEFSDNILKIVAKTSDLEDIIYQTDYAMDSNYHLYTINYINGGFDCCIDDSLIYKLRETNRIICGTRHLKAFSQNKNTGIGSFCHLYCRLMTILMYGNNKTQPKSFLIEGLNNGTLLKVGVGSLHAVNLSGITNTANVTIYDGTSTAGVKIATTGAMGPQTAPLTMPQSDGISFENGLFVTITGAACNAQIIYE